MTNTDQNSPKNKKEKLYFFIERPRFAMVIGIFITLIGMLALAGLKLEKYPDITPPQIQVTAAYPGASAALVEETIASIIEAQVNGVENMLYMTSTSSDESYALTVFFKVGSDRNINLVNVQNRVAQVTALLPQDVTRIGLTSKQAVSGAGLFFIGVYSPDNSYNQLDLFNYASIYIKDELARLPGIGEINVYGAGNYSIRVWLNPIKMANMQVSVSEIRNAILAQNTQVSAGAFGQEPGDDKQSLQITLRTNGTLKDPKQYENIIIRSNVDGSNVLLKDVARIEMGAQTYNLASSVDGQSVAMMQVIPIPGANAIEIGSAVKDKLEELKPNLPDGMAIGIFKDDTLYIMESMKEVAKTILETSLLVILIIFIFLGDARATLIPLIAIPVSLIGTFAALPAFGMSINLLTLFAMVLAVATVVDDAIVVIENVKRHIEDGKNPIEATQITMQEIGGALVAMALVLMAVFVPVAFIPGLSGIMYKQFAVCIAVSIAISAVCALSLSPAMSTIVLKHGDEDAKPTNIISHLLKTILDKFNTFFQRFSENFLKFVRKLVYDKLMGVLAYLLIILLVVVCFRVIPTAFIPTEDEGVLLVQAVLPPGATMSRTEEYCTNIYNATKDIEGIDSIINIIGTGASNSAFMVYRLKAWDERDFSGFKGFIRKTVRGIQGRPTDLSTTGISGRMRQAIAPFHDGSAYIISPPPISGMSMAGGFEFQMLSKGDYAPQDLEQYARKLTMAANTNPTLSNVYTLFQANMMQYIVNIDTEKALAQGVDLTELYATLASNIGTYYVNDFNMLGRVFRVQLRAEEEFRRNANDISRIYVKNRSNEMVPITTLVTLEPTIGAASIARYNQYRSVLINGSPAGGRSTGDAMTAMEQVVKQVLPKDIGFEWSGTSAQEREAGGQTFIVLGLALIFVYLFLVALYESWSIPFAVMLIAPVAALGALIFQLMMGTPFDLYSQVGMIMLIGLSTKQAILIVEFAKELHEKNGLSVEEAAIEATRIRLRAIMMTALAFVLGMVPLVLAHGAGSASRQSLGNTVFGGMVATSFLGTLMTPVFYVLVQTLVYKMMNNKAKTVEQEKE